MQPSTTLSGLLVLCTLILSVSFSEATPLTAAETYKVTLKANDPAPKLQTGRWMQGEPVSGFEPGKAYLIAFFANCTPTHPALPRLGVLDLKFKNKGLIVIALDCWETQESQPGPRIRQFIQELPFLPRIALDDMTGSKYGRMVETWAIPAGLQRFSLPQAFLVDKKGIIAWIGQIRLIKESIIEAVLDGTFDPKKAAGQAAADAEQKTKSTGARLPTKVTINLGDPAPRFQPGRWVQGPPVTGLQKGQADLIQIRDTMMAPPQLPR